MPAFGPERAECLVFTYKDGMLSAVAHDLKLRVGRFTVEVADDASAVDARFEARSLEVVGAMRNGAEAGGLSARDRQTIEVNLKKDVLAADRYPEIRFVSSSIARDGDRAVVQGTLTLHGRTRPLTVEARRSDGRWRARVTLRQPDFGIKPYSAMFGTLRIKPEVLVEISLPER
jgi:polyisoprenoid-binding protein YceI